MKIINKYWLLLLAVVTISACNEEDPAVDVSSAPPTYSMVEGLALAGGDYSILIDAIEHAGLTNTLATTDNITLFAPTNDAFTKLLDDLSVSSVTDIDVATLSTILQYHVVPQTVLSSGLGTQYTSLEGSEIYVVTGTDGAVNLNGKADIISTDSYVSNGIFHGIGTVLSTQPTSSNLVAHLQSLTGYDSLVAAVVKAGLDGVLSGTDEFTVFAPNNDAFVNAGIDVSATSAADLEEVLKYHVVAGRRYSQTFALGSFEPSLLGTLEDDNVQEIGVGSIAPTFQGVSPTELNISTSNGVIHTTDALLFPDFDLNDVFNPALNVSGNDGFGWDSFGALVDEAAIDRFDTLKDYYSILVPLFSPSTLGSQAAAEAFVNARTFEGNINIFTVASGTKITSVDNSSYFVTRSDITRINGSGRNSFGGGASTFFLPVFNGNLYYISAFPAPLPDDKIVKILEDNGYTLMAAAATRTGQYSGEGLKVFALTDAEFTAATGYATVAEIDALDDIADADALAELTEFIQRHAVEAIYYELDLFNDLPTFTNLAGEEVRILDDGVDLFVPHGLNDLTARSTITVNAIEANNGLIYEVSEAFDFD